MKTMLQGWNLMRILRVVLGFAIIVQGIIAKDTLSIILGVAFAGMAVANIGCCGAGGCAVNPRTITANKPEERHYEEVVSNK